MKKMNFVVPKTLRVTALVVLIFSFGLSVTTSLSIPPDETTADVRLSFLSVNAAEAECYDDGHRWYYQDFHCCMWSSGIECAMFCPC